MVKPFDLRHLNKSAQALGLQRLIHTSDEAMVANTQRHHMYERKHLHVDIKDSVVNPSQVSICVYVQFDHLATSIVPNNGGP